MSHFARLNPHTIVDDFQGHLRRRAIQRKPGVFGLAVTDGIVERFLGNAIKMHAGLNIQSRRLSRYHNRAVDIENIFHVAAKLAKGLGKPARFERSWRKRSAKITSEINR